MCVQYAWVFGVKLSRLGKQLLLQIYVCWLIMFNAFDIFSSPGCDVTAIVVLVSMQCLWPVSGCVGRARAVYLPRQCDNVAIWAVLLEHCSMMAYSPDPWTAAL